MMGDLRCRRIRTTVWWRQRWQGMHLSIRWMSWILLLLWGLAGQTGRALPCLVMNCGTQRFGTFRYACSSNHELLCWSNHGDVGRGKVLTSNAVDQIGARHSSVVGTLSVWRIKHVRGSCPGSNDRRVGA